MNNQEFRKLLLANAAKSKSDENGASPPASRPSSSTPVALGSRMKSSIPMTPRSVAGAARVDFAKQLAEQKNQTSEKTKNKFRTSAPKGSRFSQGYVDRAKQREQENEDERAERIKVLEEALKKEEIDQKTFERLRDEIAGGDLSSTHLVKGLDFKLLERVRRGEDVFDPNNKPSKPEDKQQEREVEDEDPDDLLERLESTEVKAIEKEKTQKKGQLATVALNPGQKRSRNQILAELKAARAAAKAKEQSTLGSKFKKIGAKQEPGTRIERDSKGNEVMIIVDEDGNEKRKVRKVDTKASREEEEKEAELLASREVLGMEVPEYYQKQIEAEKAAQAEEEDKEIKIFDDVDSDYDPLAGLEDSDSSSEDDGEVKEEVDGGRKSPEEKTSTLMSPPPPPAKPAVSATKNLFTTGLISEETYKMPSLDDPSFLAALKKAKAAGALEKSEKERLAKEREERLNKKLQETYRDDEDMDLGFGSSRVEDEADFDERKVKLSEWNKDDDDDYDEGGGGGGGGQKEKRKRGGKKRKGDKNNFEDVMKDTFAILLALYHPRINLLGISTVFGNASLDKTTNNALSILTSISSPPSLLIHPGASHALFRPPLPQPTDIHGESGLDGTSLLPSPSLSPPTTLSQLPAIEAAYHTLIQTPPQSAYLIATGAFTNAAALLIKYPELASHLKGVSLMGGAVGQGFTQATLGKVDGVERIGNWTQYAEFNILADPEAAQSIFGNSLLKGKITLIPLDVTHLCLTTPEIQQLILYGSEEGKDKKTKLRQMLVELLMFFAKTYSDVFGITEGPPLHDPLAVAAILGDDEIEFYDFDPSNPGVKERYEVTVVTEGTYEEAHAGARTGQTIVKKLPPGEEGVRIPRGLDIPKFWKVLEECVSRADEANAAAAGAASK
ncbi:hypothetical protein QBC38DRAFT_510618 [Podospora fimiseda]|uniref:Inosine/uridine-preferring nucleoside hydrolase domain-containing protein n=1 Tax=Podospora fimiseda TaxID=252190 RepID=A0AAN7BMP1_9PEZI|nr:hypothetical protein QBC38DRAFT_510618 [Podospora fimiseda]